MTAGPTPEVLRYLAPTGVPGGINFGNPALALETHGVAADLAGAIGGQLGVAVEFVTFDAAGKSLNAPSSPSNAA